MTEELTKSFEGEIKQFVTHELCLSRSQRKLHSNHVEGGGLTSTIRSKQAEDFTFARTESIPADCHVFSTIISLANVDSLDLVRIFLVLRKMCTLAHFIGVILNILSDFEHREFGAILASTAAMSVPNLHVDHYVDNSDYDDLEHYYADVKASRRLNRTEDLNRKLVKIGLAFAA